MTAVAGTRVGSGSAFASPFVRIQRPSPRSTMSTIRWVNVVRASPTWRDTTSPTVSCAASTGVMTTAAPTWIAGSIEAPPMTIDWRPVSGTSLPRATAPMTVRIRAIRAMSTIRRSPIVARARILIAVPPNRAAARPSRRAAAGGAAWKSSLGVVGRLLRVEGERRGRAHALERVPRGEREAHPEAEDLAGAGGEGPVAGLCALGVAADRGAIERRCGEDARPGEGSTAAATVLGLDRELELRPERVGRDRGHRVAEVAGAAVRHGQRLGTRVARHHRRDRGERGRVRADVDRAGRERPGRGRAVGELRERDRAGADRQEGDRAEQRDDPAAALPATLHAVFDELRVH